jgi:anti-sigma B factor antagonist
MPAEIDATNATGAEAFLFALIGQAPEFITADLTETTFCDSAGVRVLVVAHRCAMAAGLEFRLAVGESQVSRILDLTGVDQVVPVYHDVVASLAASSEG